MLPIHTILHPTDFSDRSRNALLLASSLARDYNARMIVLHVMTRPFIGYGEGVIPPDLADLREEAREQLAHIVFPDLVIESDRRLVEGDPAEMILKVAREESADLIVMGSHGRSGLKRLLMGSVAESVMRKSTCPVLTATSPFPVPVSNNLPFAHPAFA